MRTVTNQRYGIGVTGTHRNMVGTGADMIYPHGMSIESILTEIDAEIARLKQVRALLAGSGKVASTFTERKAKKTAGRIPKKRILSTEARKRIADAQRKRWAAQKAKAKKES